MANKSSSHAGHVSGYVGHTKKKMLNNYTKNTGDSKSKVIKQALDCFFNSMPPEQRAHLLR